MHFTVRVLTAISHLVYFLLYIYMYVYKKRLQFQCDLNNSIVFNKIRIIRRLGRVGGTLDRNTIATESIFRVRDSDCKSSVRRCRHRCCPLNARDMPLFPFVIIFGRTTSRDPSDVVKRPNVGRTNIIRRRPVVTRRLARTIRYPFRPARTMNVGRDHPDVDDDHVPLIPS